MALVRSKEQKDMKKTDAKKNRGRLSGIAKLEDANDAGTRNAHYCTLILTEGLFFFVLLFMLHWEWCTTFLCVCVCCAIYR